jgi:hypothetical protein
MFLYVIAESASGPCKVGYASYPETRIRALQTGNFRKLTLIYAQEAENYRVAERTAHTMLAKHHLGLEWFAVTGQDAAIAVKRAIFRASVSLLRQKAADLKAGAD